MTRHHLLGKARQVGDGFGRFVCLRIVMRQAVVRLLQPVCIQGFQGVTDCSMQGLTSRRQKTRIGHLLRQGMLEYLDWLVYPGAFVEKLTPFQLDDRAGQLFQKKRIAIRFVDDHLDQMRRQHALLTVRVHHRTRTCTGAWPPTRRWPSLAGRST